MSRRILVNQLLDARAAFCGIGTKETKLRLNRLLRTCDRAKAFRIALEIEDCSTLGKKYFGEWKTHYYRKKKELIHDLIKLCRVNNWTFGKQRSDGFGPTWIIYFEIEGMEQISFHCELDEEQKIPVYKSEWDGKRNSTLAKIEKAISDYFDEKRNLFY